MFRFLIGFIYVLDACGTLSTSPSGLASFNESCSQQLPCIHPLICSYTSKCTCSKVSSSWNTKQNDCLYCLPGWIPWQNDRCLLLAVPSSGGLSYDQANDACQLFSGELLHVTNFDQLQHLKSQVNSLLRSTYASAVRLFFRLGAWINRSTELDDLRCEEEDENKATAECIFIRKKKTKNDSLCLSRWKCNEEMVFICDMAALSEQTATANKDGVASPQRIAPIVAALAPVALDLVGNLLGGNKQPQQATGPQTIVIQQDSGPSAQAASSDNTLLYIGLGVGGFLLLLVICGVGVGIIFFLGQKKDPPANRVTTHRSSVESAYSDR